MATTRKKPTARKPANASRNGQRPSTLRALRESGLGYNQYAEEFQLVSNRSSLEPDMGDPKAMKQLLEDEDTERYLRAQVGV